MQETVTCSKITLGLWFSSRCANCLSASGQAEFIPKNFTIQLPPIIILGSKSGEGWVGLKKSQSLSSRRLVVFSLGQKFQCGTLSRKWNESSKDFHRAFSFDLFWPLLKRRPLAFQEATLYVKTPSSRSHPHQLYADEWNSLYLSILIYIAIDSMSD